MDTELSMYEQIMSLPLFKGTTHDQISEFLEQTPIDIANYAAGMIVAEPFDECESVYFILRGKFCLDYFVGASERAPLIKEVRGAGSAIGLDLLYGMHHNYGCLITAADEGALLRVVKKQLQQLILSSPLYFVNVMNAVSHTVQRCKRISYLLHPESLMKMMAYYVGTLTEWNSEVYIASDPHRWADLIGADADDISASRGYEKIEEEGIMGTAVDKISVVRRYEIAVEKMMEAGLIEMSRDGYFKIPSRAALLDTAFP